MIDFDWRVFPSSRVFEGCQTIQFLPLPEGQGRASMKAISNNQFFLFIKKKQKTKKTLNYLKIVWRVINILSSIQTL